MLNFSGKFPTERKSQINNFVISRESFLEEILYLEKVTKSINSQTNIKSSGNDNLAAKFL